MAQNEEELRAQLENATSYEERSRLRAQLRTLKKSGPSEKSVATTSRSLESPARTTLKTSQAPRTAQRRSPSPATPEQRSTALSAGKVSSAPVVRETVKDRPSSASSRGSSKKSPSPQPQTSVQREDARAGVNGEREGAEGDRVSEDDDIAQLEDMLQNSSDFRQRRQYRKQLEELRAAREAKLTQRRAGKTNDKHQETTPVEVVRNDASHRIAKKPSPEPEPVAKDEPRKGGDEGDQQDEQIKQLKELIEVTTDFRKKRQYRNELRDLERAREGK